LDTAVDCPNRKAITLVEWEVVKDDEVEEEKEENLEEGEEENQEEVMKEGEMLLLRRALTSQRSEKEEQRENIFHSRCTI